MATELNRPVSIHCVRDFGALFDVLKVLVNAPPAIAMHSYGGTKDMANSYMKLPKIGKRIFFSFSSCINMVSNKTLDVIKV
jgi:TatD DNase family protein